jgi:hypothetical protein
MNKKTQTLKKVLKRSMSLNRPRTSHVHLCSHNCGHYNHTTSSLVWSYNSTTMIRSKKHGYEGNGLCCHLTCV